MTGVGAAQNRTVCSHVSWQAMIAPELQVGCSVWQIKADLAGTMCCGLSREGTLQLGCLECSLHLVRQEGSVRVLDNWRQSTCRDMDCRSFNSLTGEQVNMAKLGKPSPATWQAGLVK